MLDIYDQVWMEEGKVRMKGTDNWRNGERKGGKVKKEVGKVGRRGVRDERKKRRGGRERVIMNILLAITTEEIILNDIRIDYIFLACGFC